MRTTWQPLRKVSLILVLSFLTAFTTTGTLNNTSSSLQINTSDVATGTGFLFSSSDYVITSRFFLRITNVLVLSINVKFTRPQRNIVFKSS